MPTIKLRFIPALVIFVILGFASLAQAATTPTVSSVTPNSISNAASSAVLTVNGSNFVSGAKLAIYKNNSTTLPVYYVNVESTKKITCTAYPSGVATGKWSVKVTNPDGKSYTLNSGLTVSAPAPVIPAPVVSGISPATISNTLQSIVLAVNGSNFVSGAAVKLSKSGSSDIAVFYTNVESSSKITCTAYPSGVTAGTWNVIVTNPDGKVATLASALTVTAPLPAPVVTNVSPNSIINTAQSAVLAINGTNFVSGATVKISKSGSSDLAISYLNVESSTRITGTSYPSGVSAGLWNVTVTNPDGQSATLASALTVTAPIPAPTVTGVSPNSISNTAQSAVLAINGTNFVSGATVKISKSGSSDLTISYLNVESATRITGTSYPSGVSAGSWNVTVTNPDGQSATLASAVTVTAPAPAPTVTSVSPASVSNGVATAAFTINGSNFVSGATVNISKSGSADMGVSAVSVASAIRITCNGSTSGVSAGSWNVTVTNPDGQNATLASGITVTVPAPVTAPVVSSVGPNSISNTAQSAVLAIYGSNFVSGATVKISKAGSSDLPIFYLNVESATRINGTSYPSGVTAGVWNVTVTNPDGTNGTLTSGLTVTGTSTAPAPTVASVSPASVSNTAATAAFTISGTNFVSGASVKIAKSGSADMTVSSVVVAGATQITCTGVTSGISTGTWSVTVTNPDSQSATLASGITVTGTVITPIATTMEMTGLASSVSAGTVQSATVTVKDQNGQVFTGYTGTVHFSSSDTLSGTIIPPNYTFKAADAGVKTFNDLTTNNVVRLTQVTTGAWVKVQDTVNTALSVTKSISVTASTGDKVAITSSPQTGVKAGVASAPINLQLQDTFGNAVNAPAGGKTMYLFTNSTSSSGGSSGSGKTYYISSSTGNDSNNGLSQTAAFRTAAKIKGVNFLQPGDRALFKRGDEWIGGDADVEINSKGTASNYIVIGAYGTGNAPLFTGAIKTSAMSQWINWTRYSGNIWVSNTSPANYLNWWIYTVGVGEDKNLFNVWDLARMYAGSFVQDQGAGKLYVWLEDGSDPNGKVMRIGRNTEGGDADRGLVRTSAQGSKTQYVQFEDLHVRFANRMGITSSDPNINFVDVVSELSGRAGFDIIKVWVADPGAVSNRLLRCVTRWNNASLGQAFNTEATDTWFVDCLSEYNYMAGYDFLDYDVRSNATGKMIRCVARYNGRNKLSDSWDPNIYVDGGHDVQIIDCQAYGEGNWSTANYQPGINIGTEHNNKPVYNIDIINCLSYDNKGAALTIEPMSGVSTTMSNIRVLGNTLISGTQSGAYYTFHAGSLGGNGIEMKNNIFFNTSNGPVAPWLGSADMAKMNSNNNVWYSNGGSAVVKVGGTSYSLSAFQAAYGKDSNSVQTDPKLVSTNYVNVDAHLQPNSLAVNMGDEGCYPISSYLDVGSTRTDGVCDEANNLDDGYHYNAAYACSAIDVTAPVATNGFSLTGAAPWTATSVTIPQGSASASFYYMDGAAGVYTLTVADETPANAAVGMPNATQGITIVP